MNTATYMPILKGRQGELWSLRELGSRQGVCPVIEVPRIKWNYKANGPAHTVEEHVTRFVREFDKALKRINTCAVDAYLLDGNGSDDSTAALREILGLCASRGHILTPTTGLERDSSYNRVAGRHARRHSSGCVVRLEREDLQDPEDLKTVIEDLMVELGLEPSDIDLIADLKFLREEDERNDLDLLIEMLPRLPYLDRWRSFWFAAGTFPEFLTGIPGDSEEYIARVEWTIWNALVRGLPAARAPGFADYGITHPISPDVDPEVMNMSANIRYTTEHSCLVLKGRGVRNHPRGHYQFNDLCRKLVAKDEYSGSDFSPGDLYLYDCARDLEGPGNASKWRQAGTSHHVEFVARQIAKARRLG